METCTKGWIKTVKEVDGKLSEEFLTQFAEMYAQLHKHFFSSAGWTNPNGNLSVADDTLQEVLNKFNAYDPNIILLEEHLNKITVNITEYPKTITAVDNIFNVPIDATHVILNNSLEGTYNVVLPPILDAKHKVITLVGDNATSKYVVGGVTLQGYQYGVFVIDNGVWQLFHRGLVADNIDKLEHIPHNLDLELASIRAAANLMISNMSPQLLNLFPDGNAIPISGTDKMDITKLSLHGLTTNTVEKIVDDNLNVFGIDYATKQSSSSDNNRFFIYDLGTQHNGKYVMFSFLEYSPTATFTTAVNGMYIAINGNINGGANATEITKGTIQLNANVRQHWKHCKFPDDNSTRQLYVGGNFNGLTSWYMTGFYIATSPTVIDSTKNGANFNLEKALSNFTTLNTEVSSIDTRLATIESEIESNKPNTNVMQGIFGVEGEVANSRYWTASGSVTHHIDASFQALGYPSVLLASQIDPNIYYPRISAFCTKQDMHNGGISWANGITPKVSMKASIVKSLLTNQTIGSVQLYFIVRYGDATIGNYNTDTDVLLNSNSTTSAWLGAGSTVFNHTKELIDNPTKKTFIKRGISIPETFNGKPFSSIGIFLLGYPTDGNAAVGNFTIGLGDLAIVAGSELEDKVYFPMALKEEISTTESKKITVQNSDKIVILGDSYSASHYTQKNKAYISKLAELMDWRFENYSQSGDDYAEMNKRFLDNVGTYHGTIALKDYGATYGLLISFTNDIYARREDLDLFMADIRRTVQTVMSFGIKPIISTEFVIPTSLEALALTSVAKELDVPYIDIASNAKIMNATTYAPYWGGVHPNTRTNGLFCAPLLENLKTLPRPDKSIKIYRKRAGYAPSNDNALVYNTIAQRVQRWQEISVGHHSLASSLVAKYDELDTISTFSYEHVISEYLKLQNKESVAFTDYALVEVILPTTQKDCKSVKLNVPAFAGEVFVKNNIQPLAYNTYLHYQGLECATMPTVSAGAVYTYLGVTYTVVDTVVYKNRNIVICTSTTQQELAGGTATKSSGTGDASFTVAKGYPARAKAYYEDIGNIGSWKAITISNGVVELKQDDLRYALDYDKLVFLLKKTGAFSFTDIFVEWDGVSGKDRSTTNKVSQKQTAIVAKEAKDMTLIGGAVATVANDNVHPLGTSKVVKITQAMKLQQAVTIATASRYAAEVDIIVWARYNPPIFASSGNYALAPITSDTVDYRTLNVSIYQTDSDRKSVEFTRLVGTHWEEVRIPATLLGQTISDGSFTVSLSCEDGEIEVAWFEVSRE